MRLLYFVTLTLIIVLFTATVHSAQGTSKSNLSAEDGIDGNLSVAMVEGVGEVELAVGVRGRIGCDENPKVVQRLQIVKSGVYENYLIDGKWIDSTLVKIKANNVTLRHCEIRNGLHNAIYVDSKNVLIDSCKIHHLLKGSFRKQQDAHGITGHPRKLTISNCEIYYVSGDCIQFDPGRLPWGDIVVENCVLWTEQLSENSAGFKKGERPGENAIDTKQRNGNPRSKLVLRNCLIYGWKQPGQINMMSALNIKNNVDVLVEGCVFRDNQVSFRLRGRTSKYKGALVTIKDCAVYSSDVGVRMEDNISDLTISRLGMSEDVKEKYQMAAGGTGPGYDNTGEHVAPPYDYLIKHGWGKRGDLQMINVQFKNPVLVWLPQEIDLTKHTKGPFTVRIRVEGIDEQRHSSVSPRISYYIGTGSSYGYFDMIHEGAYVWRFDIPDPDWYRYKSNRLHYKVKVFDKDGKVMIESSFKKELIDSFVN